MKKSIVFFLMVFWFFQGTMVVSARSEERQLPLFSAISLRIPATLLLEQGDVQSVQIEAREGVLDKIITEVSGRSLIIRFPVRDRLVRDFNAGKITIRITIPEISALNISGGGDIIAREALSSLILDLNVSGSGSIDLARLDAGRVRAAISGSGNIILRDGEADQELNVRISGSGNLRAEEFEADQIKVSIAGSGNAWVYSDGTISAKIAGSGNLYFRGNPDVESSIAGSGGIQELD